jgi:hypothetical protein
MHAECEHILKTLEETNWVIGGTKGAAERLGLKRTTLIGKRRRLGLSPPSKALPPQIGADLSSQVSMALRRCERGRAGLVAGGGFEPPTFGL